MAESEIEAAMKRHMDEALALIKAALSQADATLKLTQEVAAEARASDGARAGKNGQLFAAASVMLQLEAAKIENSLRSYAHAHGVACEETRALERTYEACVQEEREQRRECRVRLVTFGLLTKRGHLVKNEKMRLFVVDGAKVSYYKLGDVRGVEACGYFLLNRVLKVDACSRDHLAPSVRRTAPWEFVVKTKGKDFRLSVADHHSYKIWLDALLPIREGWLLKQGGAHKNWKKRYFEQWRTCTCYSTKKGGDVKGVIDIKSIEPGSVKMVNPPEGWAKQAADLKVDASSAYFFSIRDLSDNRTYLVQSADEMESQGWVDSIAQVVESRGRDEHVVAAIRSDSGRIKNLPRLAGDEDTTLSEHHAAEAAALTVESDDDDDDEAHVRYAAAQAAHLISAVGSTRFPRDAPLAADSDDEVHPLGDESVIVDSDEEEGTL